MHLRCFYVTDLQSTAFATRHTLRCGGDDGTRTRVLGQSTLGLSRVERPSHPHIRRSFERLKNPFLHMVDRSKGYCSTINYLQGPLTQALKLVVPQGVEPCVHPYKERPQTVEDKDLVVRHPRLELGTP